MEQKPKPDTVKALIDLKKGILQLEGPQEFVEKYLDPIMKNCKPFSTPSSKRKKSEVVTEVINKEKGYRYYVAESLGILSLGLISLALLNRSLSVSVWYWHPLPLAILGIISLLIGLCLIFPNHTAQEWLIRNIFHALSLKVIRLLGWALVLVPFGRNLIQTIQSDWAVVIGILSIIVGYAVLVYGTGISIISSIKELKRRPLNGQ